MKICDFCHFCHMSHFSGFEDEIGVFQCYFFLNVIKYIYIFSQYMYIFTEFNLYKNALCCMCQSRLIVVIKIDTICLFYQICFNTLIAFVFSYFLHILKKIVYILFIILSSQKLVIRKLIYIYCIYIINVPVVCTRKFITLSSSVLLIVRFSILHLESNTIIRMFRK